MYRAVRLAALALASALILPASAAQAKGGACLPDYPHGAHCHVWTGKVRQIDDGDTLDASVPGFFNPLQPLSMGYLPIKMQMNSVVGQLRNMMRMQTDGSPG